MGAVACAWNIELTAWAAVGWLACRVVLPSSGTGVILLI